MPFNELLDERTEVAPSPAAVAAIREMKAGIHGARHGLRIGLAAGAVMCVLACALATTLWMPERSAKQGCTREHAGFVDVKASCEEPALLAYGGDQVTAFPGVALERIPSGFRVRRGRAVFSVQKRTDGSRLRVHVSHGVIEVTGTRFTVVQDEGQGRVVLDEGTIVFHDDDGDDVTLTAGMSLAWPREPGHNAVAPTEPPAPSLELARAERTTARGAGSVRPAAVKLVVPKTAAPVPVADAEEDEDEDEVEEDDPQPPSGVIPMEEILKRISTLRRQKRLREAVTLLVSQSTRGDITPEQMARLSWEIGLFIQESGDRANACRHWQNHTRKYPDDSAHIERVRELMATCDAPM